MKPFGTGKPGLHPWWQTNYGPARRGQAGKSWYVDETYIKVHGKWCYLYRAIDADGNLVDSHLSEKRDMEAAQRFAQAGSLRRWSSSRARDNGWACFLPTSRT